MKVLNDMPLRIVACQDEREAELICAELLGLGKSALVANARESARKAFRKTGDVDLAACAFKRAVVEDGEAVS